MLNIYHVARTNGTDPFVFLEHPKDPTVHSPHQNAQDAATIWITRVLLDFSEQHKVSWVSFPQCALGQASGA